MYTLHKEKAIFLYTLHNRGVGVGGVKSYSLLNEKPPHLLKKWLGVMLEGQIPMYLRSLQDDLRTPRLEFQGGYVNLYVPNSSPKRVTPSSKRGRVVGFSRRSRKRLLDVTAKLRNTQCLFVTLTYGQQFPDCNEAKQHLRNFLKRFSRKFPGVAAIWRLELQERLAPHFHLIIFHKFIPKQWIKESWGGVIGVQYWDLSGDVERQPFTRVEKVVNRKHLRRYVSKYVAKATDIPVAEDAPVAGDAPVAEDSEGFDLPLAVGEGVGFNAMPYLTAGRVWGIHNKEFLPLADLLTAIAASMSKQFWDIKRLARKVWKGVNCSRKGFTLYVEDAEQWFNYCVFLEPISYSREVEVILP